MIPQSQESVSRQKRTPFPVTCAMRGNMKFDLFSDMRTLLQNYNNYIPKIPYVQGIIRFPSALRKGPLYVFFHSKTLRKCVHFPHIYRACHGSFSTPGRDLHRITCRSTAIRSHIILPSKSTRIFKVNGTILLLFCNS